MNIKKVDKWLDDKYGISYTEMVKIKNFLSEENERKENEIKDLTYQLAMEKAELGEANDSVVWWCNRYKAVQRELEEHKKCKLKQRIKNAIDYIENNSLYEEILDYDYEENPYVSYTTDEYVKDKLLNILNGEDNEQI